MIQQYSLITRAIKQFEADNAQLFEDYNALLAAKNLAEQNLKVWAQENGEVEDDFIKVTVVQPYKKWYDVEKLKADRGAWMILHKAGAVHETVEVDKDKADQLAKDGKISNELLMGAFMEQELSKRVSIKIKS